jgi:hypothetical protein
MSVRRRAAKRDASEAAIVAALRLAGAIVWSISEKGLPDLVVGYRGATFLLEVKSPGKGLTEAQEDVHAIWRGGPIHVVETPQDALRAVGARLSSAFRPSTDEDLAELLPAPKKKR